jgi:hypothetical protein
VSSIHKDESLLTVLSEALETITCQVQKGDVFQTKQMIMQIFFEESSIQKDETLCTALSKAPENL